MFKIFAFTAAILVSAGAFAECPEVQTTEQIVKSFEKDLDVRCGVVNVEEPNFFFCGKDPVLAISPNGKLIGRRTTTSGDFMAVHHGTLEIVEAKDLYKDPSCKGMAALPFNRID